MGRACAPLKTKTFRTIETPRVVLRYHRCPKNTLDYVGLTLILHVQHVDAAAWQPQLSQDGGPPFPKRGSIVTALKSIGTSLNP